MNMRIRSLVSIVWTVAVLSVLLAGGPSGAQPLYEEGPPPEAEQAFTDGKAALDNGQYDDAVGLFGKAIRLAEEEYAEAYLRQGLAYMELEEFQRAISALQRAIQQKEELDDDQLAEAHNGLGEAYLEFGSAGLSQALQSFLEATQIGYKNKDYLLNLGSTYVKMRGPEPAIKVLDKVIGLDDTMAKAYDARGQAHGLLVQTKPEELDLALADFAKAIELDPDDKTFYYNVGMVLLQAERFPEAINAFTKAVEVDREQQAAKQPGAGAAEPDQADQPAEQSQTNEAPAPDQPEESAEPDQPGEAPPQASQAAEDDDEGPYIQPLLARALTLIEVGKAASGEIRKKAYAQAVMDIDLALALVPEIPDALLVRGIALRLMEDYEGAIGSLTEALKLNPEFSEALYRRGIVWYYQGEFGLALADLKQAGQIVPEDVRPHVWQGFAHASRGDYYEAVKAYGRALEQDERFQPALNNRGLAYLQLGQVDKAINDFNEVLRLDPANAGAYFKRGVAYDLMGDYDSSVGSYRSAIQVDPASVAAYGRLAEAYEKLGQGDLARDVRQEAEDAQQRLQQPADEAPADQVPAETPEAGAQPPSQEELPPPQAGLIPPADMDLGEGLVPPAGIQPDQDTDTGQLLDELFPDDATTPLELDPPLDSSAPSPALE